MPRYIVGWRRVIERGWEAERQSGVAASEQRRLEIAAGTAQDRLMGQDHINAPDHWREALSRSEAELARGEIVPSQAVHDELRHALAELESELAEPDESPPPHPPGR
jgi:hypothetical protein